MTILVVMAMTAEADPLIETLALDSLEESPTPLLPARWYVGADTTLVVNGPDPVRTDRS